MIENDLQRNQELNLREKERAIAAANQNSAVARIVNLVYFVFGILEFLLAIRVGVAEGLPRVSSECTVIKVSPRGL